MLPFYSNVLNMCHAKTYMITFMIGFVIVSDSNDYMTS